MSTQAAQLIAAIRRRKAGMTYLELEALKVSTCPWRRIGESGHLYLRSDERLIRKVGRDGLKRFAIVRGAGV